MKNLLKRTLSVLLCVALIMTYLPLSTMAATPGSSGLAISDPGTADAWEDIMGTRADGSHYAGRVWVDKSVYTDGDTVMLNRNGNADSTFTVDVDEANGEYFQVVFSALGSSMSTNTQVYAVRPLDVAIVLDTSTSMTSSSGGKSRLQHMIEAANGLLEDLLALGDVRVAIVSFNRDSETIIDLAKYPNGIVLSTNHYTNTNGGGIIYAHDKNGTLLGNDGGYTMGTNLQDGIDRGMDILANAQNTSGRAPVAIVLADGRANRAVDEAWYNPTSSNVSSSDDAGVMLSTLLNAAYGRTRVEKNYNAAMTVYGIGIDLSSSSNDYIFLNPGAEGSSGFNASNRDDAVEDAWNGFTTWRAGNTATLTFGSGRNPRTWTFDHNWPASEGITVAEIAANINYVDNYQDVSSANLGDAFDNILQELSTGAFNPITTTKDGATGVEETPLIYVDNIGQYMEVKNIQALQVFGTTYNITKNADGTYSVAAGNGINPTTNETWSTASDIDINLLQNADGTQQLRIYISQEILPILLDEITVTTENDATTRTLEEFGYPPLRIYYTVGIASSLLLPDGTINPTKLDSDYAYLNGDGTADFYSNAFGKLNKVNLDGDAFVDEGDAHVGFIPSHNNRYYYHQTHQKIYIDAKDSNGNDIDWDDEMYGVLLDESKYKLTEMTYADYTTIKDTDMVYNCVTFTRPTGNGNEAEEVTYLVYATWGEMKDAVTFYDKVNNAYLADSAIGSNNIAATVSSYLNGKSNVANSDLVGFLGLQSRRVSRLHHMFETKLPNTTGTAETSYAPEYNDGAHDANDIHEHSEVIVWLGNNGKLTLPVSTGLQVTKDVTRFAENASATEAFEIRVLLDLAYTAENAAGLFVADLHGDALSSSAYAISESGGNILVTLYLADNESAIIMGVPGGTNYTVTEAEHSQYIYTYTGATQTVTGSIVEGTVTNTPILPGSLYITKEVVHAIEGEAFPTDDEFEFRVTFKDKNGNPIVTTFQLENNYQPSLTELSTDADGVMTGYLRHSETAHIKGIPDGATVTVEEVALPANGNYTLSGYRSRNQSGDVADNDGTVTISAEHNATVVVTNTYTPKSTSAKLDLTIKKILSVDTPPTGDRYFNFELEMWDGAAWQSLHSYSNIGWAKDSVVVAPQENVITYKDATPDSLGTFTKAGTYIYQIYEAIPQSPIPGMTYDRAIHTITVTVTDKNGQLVAVATDEHGAEIKDIDNDGDLDFTAEFRNVENAATVSIDIKKDVTDTSGNPLTSYAGFEFVAQKAEVDANGNWSIVPGGRSFSVYSDGLGDARMTDVYTSAGTYYYIISERDDGKARWDYSDVQYRVTVVVTGTGDLTADMTIEAVDGATGETATVTDGTKGSLIFKNTYDPVDAEVAVDTLVKKQLNGSTPGNRKFTFAIFKNSEASHTSTDKALMLGENDANGNVVFTATQYGIDQGLVTINPSGKHVLNFSRVGDYFFDVVELTGNLPGITYDSIIYDLVVEVADDDHNGKLEVSYYFEDSVNTTVIFQNTYTVATVDVVIEGIKTMKVNNGNKSIHAGDYTFYLYNEAGEKIAETTNLANGSFAFDAITYGADHIGKTYKYTVKEVAPNGTTDGSYKTGGVTWSGQSFEVTVTVTDNGDGTLSTAVTGNGSQSIIFVNEYTSKAPSVSLPGKKNLENRPLIAGEFTFALYAADRHFENLTPVSENITHDVNGDFQVDLGTLSEGRHYFLVKEVIPTNHAAGIHYSVAEYHITVVVTDHGTGEMTYATTVENPGVPDVTDADIVFTNVYSPEPDEIPLSGKKIYNGGSLENNAFSVGLYDDATGDLLQTAPIKENGSFVFDSLKFHAADVGQTYTYTIKEIIPAGATSNSNGTFTFDETIYDGTVYTLTVTVTDDYKDGVLEISSELTKNGVAANELRFVNTFAPEEIIPDPVSYTPLAKKNYNKPLKGGEFKFKLEGNINGRPISQEKTNAADGSITFDTMIFYDAGTYTFKVKEIEKILGFIQYSAAEYELVVTIINMDDELLIGAVTVNGDAKGTIEFTNTYVIDGEDEVTLRGTKLLSGGRTSVEANEFEFGLYDADGKLIEAVKNDADGNFAFTTLKFDETDVPVSGQKQITYTVKEIAGSDTRVTYDQTVYTIVVTVKDNEKGGVTATYTVDSAADGSIVFTNIYTPKPEDITVDFDIVKTVLNKGSEKIGPEGFTFLLNALAEGVADITVKTDNSGKAKFTLTFTESDVGKTYTYELTEVNDGKENVTYSTAKHTITVAIARNENNKLVATLTKDGKKVTAVVAAFENTYDYTPVQPTDPEPEQPTEPEPDKPQPDNPQTGDNAKIYLWIALLFVSGGGILGLALYSKKKTKEENETDSN